MRFELRSSASRVSGLLVLPGAAGTVGTVAAMVLLLLSPGCKKSAGNDPCAADVDGDGYNACNDCADDNPALNPGMSEVCGNALDDNCDGNTDEQCGDCNPNLGDTLDCGVTDSGCIETCQADFSWGACLPANGSTPDYQSDVAHCGQCGKACATPLNAQATCNAGQCGRGACAKGFFDLDGGSKDGCHWSCVGLLCTRDSGETVSLSAPPIPETGLQGRALASGGSLGDKLQVSPNYTNFGVLGESGITATDSPVQTSQNFQHQGGLIAGQPQ